jgi:1-acyl-sn-glycerol-3-phosphate acyltransferase
MKSDIRKIYQSSKDVVLTSRLGTRGEPEVVSGEESEDVKRFNRLLNEINSPFEQEYAFSVVQKVLNFIDKYYFRSRFAGIENGFPERNDPLHPLIYASNHSGMSFPWDGIVMTSQMLLHNRLDFSKSIRPVVAPMLSQSIYMNPFMIQNFWKRMGGVDATLENFEAMMHSPDANVLIYPEGVPGIGKGFDKRYQLQRVSSSFIRMALKFEVDVVPVSTINGEFLNPYSYKSDQINKIVNQLKIPFLPLGPMSLLAPIYPWAFYFALPAKLVFSIGKPIKVYKIVDKPFHKIKKKDLNHIKDVVQDEMQRQLNEALELYGKDPFEWDELRDLWASNMDKIMYILPSGWPALFLEHDRLFKEHGGGNFQMDYSNGACIAGNFKTENSLSFNIPVAGWLMLLKNKGII